MDKQKLGQHEMLELHEMMVMKTVCASKSLAMARMAQDTQLQTLFQADADLATKHLQQLQGVVQNSMI